MHDLLIIAISALAGVATAPIWMPALEWVMDVVFKVFGEALVAAAIILPVVYLVR